MNVLSHERRCRVIASLVDGMSLRAVERTTDVTLKTVGRLALDVGEGCQRLHDRIMRDLTCAMLQFDEQHSWVHTRHDHVKDSDPDEWGEQWAFFALDVASRAKISALVGKRTAENTLAFVQDVRDRVLGTPTISSDGFKPYVDAVEIVFGADCRFGQLVKQYDDDRPDAPRRPNHYKGAMPVPVIGGMRPDEINTSYLERANLTHRLDSKRFTRRTLCFSKRLRNHAAAVWMHTTAYNFVRIHRSLRVTPAMALGVADHPWSISELVTLALAEPPAAAPPPAVEPIPTGEPTRPVLRLIPGGRAG